MKVKKSDLFTVREAEKDGHVVSMTNVVLPNRTALNNRLNMYFRKMLPVYDGGFGEDDGEDVLYSINEYIQENNIDKYSLDFPVSGGTDIHLIPITDNLQIKVVVVDEYYGSGDYQRYVSITHFMINEKTTESDVDRLVQFLKEYIIH